MTPLAPLSAGNVAFGKAWLASTAVAGTGGYFASKHFLDNAKTDEQLNTNMFKMVGGVGVVGGIGGLAAGITPGKTLDRGIPNDNIVSDLDQAVRESSQANEAAIGRSAESKILTAGKGRLGGGAIGALTGVSLGVFALALTAPKSPMPSL